MFTEFFLKLREANVPATLGEYLTLLEALDEDVADTGIEEFYYLSRSALVRTSVTLISSTVSLVNISKESRHLVRRFFLKFLKNGSGERLRKYSARKNVRSSTKWAGKN